MYKIILKCGGYFKGNSEQLHTQNLMNSHCSKIPFILLRKFHLCECHREPKSTLFSCL